MSARPGVIDYLADLLHVAMVVGAAWWWSTSTPVDTSWASSALAALGGAGLAVKLSEVGSAVLHQLGVTRPMHSLRQWVLWGRGLVEGAALIAVGIAVDAPAAYSGALLGIFIAFALLAAWSLVMTQWRGRSQQRH